LRRKSSNSALRQENRRLRLEFEPRRVFARLIATLIFFKPRTAAGAAMEERRQDTRIAFDLEGMHSDEFSNLWSPYAWRAMTMADMSKNGIAFVTNEDIGVGSRRYFRLWLPDHLGLVKFAGDVVYQSEFSTTCKHRVGVRIVNILPVYAERIDSLLNARLPA
jgi:hypothetical protein